MFLSKVALITGSTSGIGLAIAKALATEGYQIILSGFADPDLINELIDEFQNDYNQTPAYHNADLSKKEGIMDLLNYAKDKFKTIDVLVNNAGIQHVAKIEEFPDEKWEQILMLNLSSSFYLIKNCIEDMKKKGWGRIINIASTHGLVASANKSAYVAAKHGLIGLTKVVALETAGLGITCNAICPGWVLTPLVQKQIDDLAAREKITNDEARIKLLSEKQPSKNFTKPEDIGAMAVHLASEAGNNMTGSVITIDGGWTSQ